MKVHVVLTLSLVLLTGCAAPREVIYDESAIRKPTTAVEVFRDGVKPEKPYKEIGEIAFEDFGGEEPKVMQEIVTRAKELGANAIIMQPRTATGYQFNPFGRSGDKFLWKGIAVVYTK